jgi:hypothetical protein
MFNQNNQIMKAKKKATSKKAGAKKIAKKKSKR